MVYGIYQSAAGMLVNQYRQEVLANNLANVSTVGFKPDLAVVRERMVASKEGFVGPLGSHEVYDRMTGGSLVAPTFTSFEQGPIVRTDNPLDVAIQADGFFAVQDGDTTRYTRDGRFTLNHEGMLITVAGGHPVLSETGTPIRLPANARGRAHIDANGEVRSGTQRFGKLGVFDFADERSLTKHGGNLLTAHTKPTPIEPNLAVRSVEQSAVDPTATMVSLIEVSRAYQLNATMVGLADATLGRAVNDIARMR